MEISTALIFVSKADEFEFLEEPFWSVSAPKSFPSFLKNLADLLPADSILYLEGSMPRAEVEAYLDSRKLDSISRIPGGTILPRPRTYHLTINREILEGLAATLEPSDVFEVCDHVHVYQGHKILLQWYDASASDPVLISKEIAETKLHRFCELIGSKYK